MSNVFRIALPNSDVNRGKASEMVLDNRYPNPKIDTAAKPPHAGIIYWSQNDATLAIDFDVTKVIYSFPHRLNYIPTVFGSYKFDNGNGINNGTLPIQYGALGMITIDADDKNINLKYYSLDGGIPATAIGTFILQVKFYVMVEHGYE